MDAEHPYQVDDHLCQPQRCLSTARGIQKPEGVDVRHLNLLGLGLLEKTKKMFFFFFFFFSKEEKKENTHTHK